MSYVPAVIGIVLIVIAIVSLVKLLRNVFMAIVMVAILLIGVFMVLNSLPSIADKAGISSLKDKFGKNISADKFQLPDGVSKILLSVGAKSENIDVVATGTDDKGDMLVVVANTGRNELKDFVILVEGKPISWRNKPLIPLSSGKSTVFQTNYRPVGEVNIEVKAGGASARYP